MALAQRKFVKVIRCPGRQHERVLIFSGCSDPTLIRIPAPLLRHGDAFSLVALGIGGDQLLGKPQFSWKSNLRVTVKREGQAAHSGAPAYAHGEDGGLQRLDYLRFRTTLLSREGPKALRHGSIARQLHGPIVAALLDRSVPVENPAPIVMLEFPGGAPRPNSPCLVGTQPESTQDGHEIYRADRNPHRTLGLLDGNGGSDRISERPEMINIGSGKVNGHLLRSDGPVGSQKSEPVGLFLSANVVKKVLCDDVSSHAEVYLDSYQRLRFLPAS
jgi:hypothetical protein